MRDLLSTAFPARCIIFLFVNEPFRSKARKLLSQVLHKRKLTIPTTLTHLLLPPVHSRDWKAKLGLWLQHWVSHHTELFPSLFLLKLRVVETRSSTLGDCLFNYRKWQRQWTPDTSFSCSCFDVHLPHALSANSHAVSLSRFDLLNSAINQDTATASMKDQYYGETTRLHAKLCLQIRKPARRWNIRSSIFEDDAHAVLDELLEEHRHNMADSGPQTLCSRQCVHFRLGW